MNMTTTPDILVIEDDPIMREALADWLQAAGYRVRTVPDGSAGLAAVTAAPPKLVIGVIAISGLFDSGHGLDAHDALALGAARALAKPFKRAELLRATAEVLSSP